MGTAVPLNYATLAYSFIIVLSVSLLQFGIKLYKARKRMLQLRSQGLPMPPYSPIFGHLAFAYKITSSLPKDAHPNYLPDMIRRALPELGPVFYLDTWPFGPQMLVAGSLSTLHQITQEHPLPKYHALKSFLQPIADGQDIVTMEGPSWKKWRGIFNPGFSMNHLMTLTSGIVEETSKFCEALDSRLKSRVVFPMKSLTDFLTLDIIGKIVFDVQLDSQSQSNPLVDGLRMQSRWLMFGGDVNPLERYNPMRPLVHRYNKWRMDSYISKHLDTRLTDIHGAFVTKSIVDLALRAYVPDKNDKTIDGRVDATFRSFAISQIKLFLFSGHDTTSSSVCYLFYVLANNLSIRSRMRAEHNEVLGSDVMEAASIVSKRPSLLNQLPYTTAVIKETLRLYPAVSSTRAGEPGFDIVDDHGRHFPTDGFLVWANPQSMHRDPAYWPEPEKFIPERWLAPVDDPLHPVKGAWRPFEHGPRNCIGQELAMMEMKIILVMTVRRFNIETAYEDLDKGKGSSKLNTVYGERGYQIQRAQPSGDLPCRVVRGAD